MLHHDFLRFLDLSLLFLKWRPSFTLIFFVGERAWSSWWRAPTPVAWGLIAFELWRVVVSFWLHHEFLPFSLILGGRIATLEGAHPWEHSLFLVFWALDELRPRLIIFVLYVRHAQFSPYSCDAVPPSLSCGEFPPLLRGQVFK